MILRCSAVSMCPSTNHGPAGREEAEEGEEEGVDEDDEEEEEEEGAEDEGEV